MVYSVHDDCATAITSYVGNVIKCYVHVTDTVLLLLIDIYN